jgi:hypothetical protein
MRTGGPERCCEVTAKLWRRTSQSWRLRWKRLYCERRIQSAVSPLEYSQICDQASQEGYHSPDNHTAAIKQDIEITLDEIARLGTQLSFGNVTLVLNIPSTEFTFARYLVDLVIYAETVYWSGNDSDAKIDIRDQTYDPRHAFAPSFESDTRTKNQRRTICPSRNPTTDGDKLAPLAGIVGGSVEDRLAPTRPSRSAHQTRLCKPVKVIHRARQLP